MQILKENYGLNKPTIFQVGFEEDILNYSMAFYPLN